MRTHLVKRSAMLAGLAVLTPLLLGIGDVPSPIPFPVKIAGTQFVASVVVDPHEAHATTTARRAFIRISRPPIVSSAVFDVPLVGFPFMKGCDLSVTDGRFLQRPLIHWIPEPVLDQLFAELGAPRSATNEPVITQIEQEICTPDPANPATPDGSLPGILSFQATIRFLRPK